MQHVNGRSHFSSVSKPESSSSVRSAPIAQANQAPRQKLNVRFLIGLIVSASLFAGIWYGVNRWQVRRHASNLLQQADQAESQQRLDRACRYVGLYVGLVPSDVEARARYGLLLERLADSPSGREGALAVFEQVLIRDPGRQDIRRRVAKLTVELSRFDDAVHHLTALSTDQANDGEIQELLGRAYEGRGEHAKAASCYQKGIAAAPERVEPYLRLARLQRDRLGRTGEVETTLDKLVKANGQSYRAYLARARYRMEGTPTTEALEAARRDMDEALRLAPDEPEVLLRAADLAVRLPNGFEQGRKHLRRVLELHPQFIAGYEALAQIELAAGHLDDAVTVFRSGLEKNPEQPELLWNLTNLLIQRDQLDEAEQMLGRLDKLAISRPRRDFLRAALKMQRGDWVAAKSQLEAVRPLVTDSRPLTIQCDLLLADCCEKASEHEMAILICRRAIALDAQQFGARLRLIKALERLGRAEEALNECQRMMAGATPPPAGWSLLARLLIAQNLRLTASQQQWSEIDRVLDRAAECAVDSAEVALLKAETLLARQDSQSANQTLERARAKEPRQEGLWLASVDLALRDGKPELARRIVTDAEKQLGDGAALRLIRLNMLLASADSKKDLHALEAGLDKLSVQDRSRVLSALAEAILQAGHMADARRLRAEVARLRPSDLEAQLRCFDLALEDNDEPGMEETLATIRRLEGEGGTFGRYDEARRLIWKATRGDKSGLTAARAELDAVGKRRPGWSRVFLCLGQVWDLEGHQERALEHYLRAVELGEKQLEVVRRVVGLLYERGRFTEAEIVLQRLPERTPILGDMRRLVAEVSMQSGNYNRALDLARQTIKAGSQDHREYIWLGQVLWAASQRSETAPDKRRADEAEAEKAFYRAVELAGKLPETWVALVQHLARTGQTEKAEAQIEKAKAQLPAEQASLALAQCYAILNKMDKARELFAAALQARPEDTATLQIAADFYLRVNELPTAERCLRKIISGAKEDRIAATKARSLLAVVLAAQGGDQQAKEALALIGKTEDTEQDDSGIATLERERARAVVLAMRPDRAEQRKAIDILERLSSQKTFSSEDRFLLVQLYDRIGNSAKARERMLPLLKLGNARYLSYHILSLLRQGLTIEAEAWMADLGKIEPSSLRTDILKARLLKAQDRGSEAGLLLKRRAEGQKDPQTLLNIAVQMEEIGCGSDAIPIYRRYVEQVKTPEAVFPLARCLGRQNQMGAALDLCEGAWKTCPAPQVAAVSLDILQAGRAEAGQLDRVESRLKEALEKNQSAGELLLMLGSLQELRGRYKEAETLYRQVLQRDSRNAVALNNLAWIVALRDGKGEEALGWINNAIQILGPIPELLDTRAVVLMAAGKTDLAVADLQTALERPNLDPKVRFSISIHLVQANQFAGNSVVAKKMWRDCHTGGARVEALHGLERGKYEQLLHQLGQP